MQAYFRKLGLSLILTTSLISSSYSQSPYSQNLEEALGRCDRSEDARRAGDGFSIATNNNFCMDALHHIKTRSDYVRVMSRLAVINRDAGNNKTALDIANAILKMNPNHRWTVAFINTIPNREADISKLEQVLVLNDSKTDSSRSVFDVYRVRQVAEKQTTPEKRQGIVRYSSKLEKKELPQEVSRDQQILGALATVGLIYAGVKIAGAVLGTIGSSSSSSSGSIGKGNGGEWGALAIDGNRQSRYGFSYDYESESEAKRRASNECGNSCSPIVTFRTGCAAYAADQSGTAWGWDTATSGSLAQSKAMSRCTSEGGRNCVVRAWGCNSN